MHRADYVLGVVGEGPGWRPRRTWELPEGYGGALLSLTFPAIIPHPILFASQPIIRFLMDVLDLEDT